MSRANDAPPGVLRDALIQVAKDTRARAVAIYRFRGTDVATFAVTAILLMFVAFLASYVPARRAMRIDPMEALRVE